MQDLVDAQYIGSKDTIRELQSKNERLYNEIMLLQTDIAALKAKLNTMEEQVWEDIRVSIQRHEATMPHHNAVVDITSADHNWLVELIRHEANDVAMQAINIALTNIRLNVSYSTGQLEKWIAVSNMTNV